MNYEKMFYKYGYFSEYLPPCFNSDQFYNKRYKLRGFVNSRKFSDYATLDIYKTELSRRTIQLPNPEQYMILCKSLIENIDEIKSCILKSKNTESNPFKERGVVKFLDIVNYKEKRGIGSDLLKTIKSRFRYAMGFKYMLYIDITLFYSSIYTHVIPRLFLSKECARNKDKKHFSKEIDRALMRM